MANVQAQFGFKHIGCIWVAAHPNGRSRKITVASIRRYVERRLSTTPLPNRRARPCKSEVEAAAAGGGRVLRGKRDYLGGAGDGGAS
jgi:hypothetical protein